MLHLSLTFLCIAGADQQRLLVCSHLRLVVISFFLTSVSFHSVLCVLPRSIVCVLCSGLFSVANVFTR